MNNYTLKTGKMPNIYTLDTETLPESSIEYLLRYGFNKSMADSHASVAAEVAAKSGAYSAKLSDPKAARAWSDLCANCGIIPEKINLTDPASLELVETALRRVNMTARLQALLDGTIRHGDRGGPRLDPVEAAGWDAAKRVIEARIVKRAREATAAGRKPEPKPSGKALSVLVDELFDRDREKYLATGRRDIEEAAAAASSDDE